ncbi:aminotransferase class V-fold PLP-dependent enzyme [Corynebacterium sp. Marseille-Q2516]
MAYDVAVVRGRYGSLGDGWTHLNAHDRPQLPVRVSGGVNKAFRAAPTPTFGAHTQAEDTLAQAREAIADLVGSTPELVVLGASLEGLYAALAREMHSMLRHGSSIVLSHQDSPRLSRALEGVATDVRWAHPDLGTGELPAFQFSEIIDPTPRLVSTPAAHELLGAVPPVREIVERAHRGARLWVLVDVSAYAPYKLIDVDDWDADILAIDLAQMGGPEVSALIFRTNRMLGRLDNPEALASRVSAGLAGGVAPLVDHYANLVDDASGTRRDRLRYSLPQLDNYLHSLGRDLTFFLGALPSVHIFGVSGEVAAGAQADRTARISFAVKGVPAETVQGRLLDNGLFTALTPHTPLLRDMGAEEIGGAVTVSLAPFNTNHDIDHLTRVVASLA